MDVWLCRKKNQKKLIKESGACHFVIEMKKNTCKAFDSKKWDYNLDLLQRQEFPNKFREWITVLLATFSLRILLNGVPGSPPPIKLAVGFVKTTRFHHSCLSLQSTLSNVFLT